MKKFGLTLLTAFAGGAMALGAYKLMENKYTSNMSFEDKQKVYFTSNHLGNASSGLSSSGQPDFVQAAAAVTPAVVYIRTTYSNQAGDEQQSQLQQMFGQMFGQRMPQQQQVEMASGSGVIISPDGYIVTNNHVVDKAVKIEVVTNDHRDFKARVIGTDPNTDLALIKIEGHDLPIVKLGNSDNAKVGEWVLAVGNPFKLTSTVTAGIISAKGRNIGIIGSEDNQDQESPFGRTQYQQKPKSNPAIESFIQTDAAINPGNSGGALVNTNGELIGINSAIASHTGSYEGYGFAIPINLAKKVLDDIEKFGKVKRGYVGISFRALDEDVAADLKIDRTAGLYVDQVLPGGGAAEAGLQKGDIITKVDGNMAYESSDLQETVGRLEPGDKIHLTVLHDGAEKNFTVTLHANNPQPEEIASTSTEELYNKIGASFVPLNSNQKAKFHVEAGVIVTQVRNGGLFDYTDVPEGSVITSINKQPIASVNDIDKALSNLQHGVLTISGYYPDGTRLRSTIEIQ
jgi:serine protease Do